MNTIEAVEQEVSEASLVTQRLIDLSERAYTVNELLQLKLATVVRAEVESPINDPSDTLERAQLNTALFSKLDLLIASIHNRLNDISSYLERVEL